MTQATQKPFIELRAASRYFGSVIALKDVSFSVRSGEILALLGDNGAGKSTLIKILSGVHQLSEGEMLLQGERVSFETPSDAREAGIATVFQDLAMVSLMSVARNFFMGREPTIGRGVLRRFDLELANRITHEEMQKIGIQVRDPGQAVGTLSGGERQCVAIARAVYFGAKLLILDEPTSALGVRQTKMVLSYILQARARGLGVIFITHNVDHAMAAADSFAILNHGRNAGFFRKGEVSRDEITEKMGGGRAAFMLEDVTHPPQAVA